MSSTIWTQDALSREAKPYKGTCWRLVEAQHRVSTLKLTDTLDEQALLEEMIEETKLPVPPECRHLDYLLSTPFRYKAMYPGGSRFRRAGRTAGVFYASEGVETAVAEMAFYRLLFFAESPATPWPGNASEYTAFSVRVAVAQMIDLSTPPLSRDAARWMSLTDYTACQGLAGAAREAVCGAIRYVSVRDPERGCNVALLTCRAFAAPAPVARQTWRLHLSAHGVQALCDFPKMRLPFDPACFADDPRLRDMIWER